MLEVEFVVLMDYGSARFALIGRGSNLSAEVLFCILFNNDAVLGHLLLDEENLLGALDDKVPPGVVGTLLCSCKLVLVHGTKPAIACTEHHWHAANADTTLDAVSVSFRVFQVHIN